MAILLLYRKVRETETEVEYAYRHGMEGDDAILILDAKDPTAEPISGAESPGGERVAAQLLWLRQQRPTWPETGSIQS